MSRLALLTAILLALLQPTVPVEREPMHRVVFENALVRVIDAEVPAGSATQYHTHDRDNVPIAVAPGLTRVTPLGGAPLDVPAPLGRISFSPGGYTHEVRNTGTTSVRFIDVELLGPPGRPTGVSPAAVHGGHRTALDTERVIVHRVTLAAGGRLEPHRHAGPLLEVVVRGSRVVRDAAAVPADPGSFTWRDDGRVPLVHNVGEAEFELVEVEWKAGVPTGAAAR